MNTIIAIDPDVEKSGVAIVDRSTRRVTFARSLTFPDLLLLLNDWSRTDDVMVVFEDSAFTTANWHLSPTDSKYKAAALGRSVGMCHATARHLKECAENLGMKTDVVRPFMKTWSGPGRKITQAEALSFMHGLPERVNQDVRDAALIAWVYASLPIRITAKMLNK